MSRLLFLSAALATCLAAPALADEPVRTVDAGRFEVQGIRLGMNLAEATAAVAQQLGIAPGAIQVSKPSRDEPQVLLASNPAGNLTVTLAPGRLDGDPRRAGVYSVRWSYKGLRDLDARKAAVLARYGLPTNGTATPLRKGWEWCLHPDDGSPVRCLGTPEPTLTYYEFTLELQDSSRLAEPGDAPAGAK